MIPATPTLDESRRLAALEKYAMMDTLPEQALDDLTALAAQICGTPIAMISLVDEHRQWFKSKVGMDMTETARDISFCGHAVHQHDLFIVPDATLDERFVDNPLVTGNPKIRFYAGAPLLNPEDAALGVLCVIDHVPRVLTQEQEQALRVLGRQVMTHLELHRRSRELIESERKFRQVAENITDVFWVTSPDLNEMHYVSPAYEQIWGRATKDLYAHPHEWFDSILLEDRKHVFEAFAALIQDVPSVSVEYRVGRPDGTIRWVHDRGFQVRDDRGVLVRLSGIASDITDRKQVDLASLRLGAIVEYSDDAIIGKNLDSIITSWNRGAEKIFGYTESEMVGNSIMRLIPTDRRDEENQILEKIKRGESVEHFETLRQRKDGRLINVSVTASPIKNAVGKPIGVSKIARDITAYKEAEKALRDLSATQSSILNALPAHIALIDHEGVIVSVNEAWRQFAENNAMKGVDSGVGDNYIEICERAVGKWSDKAQAVALGIRRILQHELAVFTIEYPCHSPTVQRWFLLQVVAVGEGRPAGAVVMHVDISARKLTESALQKERDFISAVVDTVGSLVVVLDRQARIVRFNRACEQLTGYLSDDVLGQNLIDLVILPEERATTTAEFGNLCAGQFPNTYENHWLTKHGEPRVIAWSNTALVDADGVVEYVIGTGTDITERKRTEEALRESRATLDSALASMSDALFITDGNGRFIEFNDAFVSLHRFKQRDECYKAFSEYADFLEVFLPNGELAPLEMWAVPRALQGETAANAEFTLRRKDTGETWIASYSFSPIRNNEGVIVGSVTVARDITERKRNAEQIAEQAALLDKAQDAIVMADLESKIQFWNKGAERMYGWSKEEALGRKITELIAAKGELIKEIMAALLDKGECTSEVEHFTKDGRRLTVEARRTLIRDDGGNPRSLLAIYTDVTEKKKIEAQFMRAQRMESIGTLAGGIAHDLNNILAPIMMSIDILKTLSDNPQAKNILETIETSSKRGADIVRQVLSFARGMEGERVEIQPTHLLKDLESIIKDTFPKDIQLKFSIPNDTWTILGDPTQVHQILLNLCVNARDAMPGGGNLTVSVENCLLDEHYAAMNIQAKPGRYVNISVTDSGTGIQPAILDKIFEPFFTTKELNKGTGLGLSTVMAIVKSHDGIINVYSEPGKGTTFKVYLRAMELSSEGRKEQPEQACAPRGNGETVLVVDDEASILTITGQTLQAFGYRVLTATDGADAVGVYAKHMGEIAVVLTDMMMPVMDGPAMIHALMRMNPAIKIVAASGLNANGSVAKVSGLGVKHFLTKPYTAGTLLRTLRTMLDET